MYNIMHIIVPSRARYNSRLSTVHALNDAGIDHSIVVRNDEYDNYKAAIVGSYSHVHIVKMRSGVEGLPSTRQWVTEKYYPETVLFVDDDMVFYVRPVKGDDGLRYCEASDIVELVDTIERLSHVYAHVGVSLRQGNNRVLTDYKEITGLHGMYAMNTGVLMEEDIRHDMSDVMEDKHVVLSLLERGWPNVCIYKYCIGQKETNSPGGCSIYRTPERQTASAYELATMHAPFVTVRKAFTKSGGWFSDKDGRCFRYDTTIYWKKAFESWKGDPKYV